MMLEMPQKYVGKAAVSWGKSVSGPVFAILSFILLVSQLAAKDAPTAAKLLVWGSWLTLCTALLFVLIAQFRVWREEHECRCKLEEKLNAAADIRGPIWVQLSAVNPNADQTKPASALGYTCDCSNHGRVPCELGKIVIKIVPPGGFGFNLLQDILLPQVIEPGRAFKYASTCGIQGVSPDDLRKSKITVCLDDSLGKEYQSTETKVTNMVLSVTPHGTAQRVNFEY